MNALSGIAIVGVFLVTAIPAATAYAVACEKARRAWERGRPALPPFP